MTPGNGHERGSRNGQNSRQYWSPYSLPFSPARVAGLLVGLCFLGTFWYWAIGIACISLPYIMMDRVQVRLYHGYIKGKPFLTLITYAFSSTDYRPCYVPWWNWRWYYWR